MELKKKDFWLNYFLKINT